MPNVQEINDLEALSGLRPAWNELLAKTPGASFFQSLDWLTAYWRHFGDAQRQRLRVLIVGDGNRPTGILPLAVRSEATRIGPVRLLGYPLDDWGTFYSPIGPDPLATLAAGLDHVRRTPQDWDILDLRWTSDSTGGQAQIEEVFREAGYRVRGEPWARVALVDLGGSWDDYWAGRTSHWRNNVRRSEKKLAEQGTIEYVRYRPAGETAGGAAGDAAGDTDPRWDLYNACEQIAERSWQGDSQTGNTLTHAAVRPFLRDAHAAAARTGALDLNLLRIDGRPVAFNYAYHYRGYVFGLRTGFDASATQAAGAGSVLQSRMIEDCFARKDRVYDLGADYLESKRHWQTCVVTSYRYAYYPPAVPRAQVLRLKRWIARSKGRER